MPAETRDQWFAMAATAVSEIVDRCGGAIVMTKEGLHQEACEVNPQLGECPNDVWTHLSCALKYRHGLQTASYKGTESTIVVFSPTKYTTLDHAIRHCKNVTGISGDVRLAVLDARPSRGVLA